MTLAKVATNKRLDSNLYVGTSASEILHFVQIPPDPEDTNGAPSYILASRLPPSGESTNSLDKPGVQQILLLPKVQKAVVLCNGTARFYSLPELSPILENTVVHNCGWIGGVDLNEPDIAKSNSDANASTTILLSLRRKIRLVKVGLDARGIKYVDFVGSTISVRRDSFACVADSRSYALLDVERALKIPLFPISSLDDSQASNVGGQAEDISGNAGGIQRSASTIQRRNESLGEPQGHSRASSLGNLISAQRQRAFSGSRDTSVDRNPDQLSRGASPVPASSPRRPLQRDASPNTFGTSPDKPLPPAPDGDPTETNEQAPPPPPKLVPVYLKPHIVSPSPQEFLLVTGTGPSDPGVGMFVNLEGDVTRSTLEFERYPEVLVADGRGVGIEMTQNNADDEEEGYVLASMRREVDGRIEHGFEIQRWDLDPGEGAMHKAWLSVNTIASNPSGPEATAPGIRAVLDNGNIIFDEVAEKLRLRRFRHTMRPTASELETQSLKMMPAGAEEIRDEEEGQFATRFGHTRTSMTAWSGNKIWWVVRNPLTLQLDASLEAALDGHTKDEVFSKIDRQKIVEIINSVRGREAKTEVEFMGLGYIRQHAGLLLLINLINSEIPPLDAEDRIAEEALLHGSLDPRVIISLIPRLRKEVVEGRQGIWIHGGVLRSTSAYLTEQLSESSTEETFYEYILYFYKRFLEAWRNKKGFGSIASENEVFRSVDAALLIVLLELDKSSPRGPERKGSIRSDLNRFVDNGVECFDRAVLILESYHRLYVLSRLYQSRRMAEEVLATWKRLIEGQRDEGGEFQDGEQKMRSYLSNLSNQALVEEYGVWLASRNVHLGIQIFADEKTRVKFVPTAVVELLRNRAPAAVKEYLEYLVFTKNHTQYVNELIAYYLDIVVQELESCEDAKRKLAQTYETYRALRAPKPTYRQFITDNALDEDWWQSRLRLLQLLGGSHGSATDYDVARILDRIAPFTQELVPEVIILNGRQSHHQEALHLLTHNLGDYDTAINYCLLGGSSIYHPISGARDADTLPSRDEQAKLFGYLLGELLTLQDTNDRVEQTGGLLERFGGWFDVSYVLSVIPDGWAVELVSGFLVSALRRIVRERSETMVAKALSGVENLKISADLIDQVQNAGARIEASQ